MEDGGPTAYYILFFALLLLDMAVYGFGEALKSLSTKELAEKMSEEPLGKQGRKAKKLYEIALHPEGYVNTVQLVTTLLNVMIGALYLPGWIGGAIRGKDAIVRQIGGQALGKGTPLSVWLTVAAMIAAVFLLLYILLTLGVLLPKRLGVRYPEKWAYGCITPVYAVMMFFTPLTGLVSVTASGVLKLFGIDADDSSEDVTEEEIISMVNEGHEQGVLLATEAEMITNIFEFGDKEAKDIMTQRKNILGLDRNTTLSEALDYMLNESKSRFPVYEENIDHIIGVLHFRDAMRAHRIPQNMTLPIGEIPGLIRETMFVPETKKIDGLFRTMQQTKTQMVVVVDEYGQTSGLLAMEDILEEIVGNILDEYDEDEEYIEETGNADEYIIDGATPLEELEERFRISFREEEFETLNGYLISRMDKIPDEDDEGFSVSVGGYEFKILSVENRMIKSVLVTKLPGTDEGTEEEKEQEKGEK